MNADPATNRSPLLALDGLTYRVRERTLLDRVDLELTSDGCTVVMGPNGAGKSVLLRLLHGLLAPTEGRILWYGEALGPAVISRQALVFQKPVLLRRSAIANLDFVLRVRRGDRTRAAGLLERVGLGERAQTPARRLSGGEQQRLALARALALEPAILLLDEPTASLDPASMQTIEDLVMELREGGVKTFFVTHDVGQARRLADDVLFLHRGRLVEHAPATQFFSNASSAPARDYLAGRLVV